MDLTSLSQKQLLDLWDEEVNFERRDKLMVELKRRKLFPSMHEYMYEMTTGAYPDASLIKDRGQYFARDPEFLQKLMARREFAESVQHDWKLPSDPCEEDRGFEITPVQRFVANFMSPKTPYESALLFHGVGVGKTCAAIQIAENWLAMYPTRKVVIVAPPTIQAGFRTTLFDITRLRFGETKGSPNSIIGCTGTTYLELSDTLFLQPDKEKKVTKEDYDKDVLAIKERIQMRVNQQINRRYEFYGYISFANHIKKIIKHSKTIEDPLAREEDEKERINELFDGTLLIVDEAHNLRELPQLEQPLPDEDVDSPGGASDEEDSKAGKLLTPYLDMVLKYTVGMKFVLMTATPMYNSYREIIFLLNLLLKNDAQAQIKETDIFNSNGTFREKGEETLGLIASRYISFMRGENPQSFPLRLAPEDREVLEIYPPKNPRGGLVDEDETIYMDHLPIVTTELTGDSLEAVRYFSSKLTPGGGGISSFELEKIVQAGNLVVPLPAEIEDGDAHFEDRVDVQALQLHFAKSSNNGEVVWTPRGPASATWLGLNQLGNYSPKFAKVISYVNKAHGVCFLYTRFVAAGAIPLALALEANGYLPYNRKTGLLGGGAVTPGGLQCALCENREATHKEQDHKFTPARYILLTGDSTVSPNNAAMIKAEKVSDNVRGGRIKVVIGSQVASEGVDLKYVREIHVLDSWYHLNKTEQIIGRGIRFRSHCALPAEERNTTIYLHAATRPIADRRESGDLYSYRVAFRKGRQVGRVTRVLKQYALDCNLNHDAILIANTDPLKEVRDAQGNVRENVSMDDVPFTAVCDWMEECDYRCAVPFDVDPGKSDDISYDEFSARWRESKIKNRLREMFSTQAYYSIEKLSSQLLGDVPKAAQADLLYKIVGNKSFSVNYNGREGYIIYKNGYYLFQPIRFVDIDIPLALRISSYPIKVETYQPHDIFGEVMQRLKARKEAQEMADEEGGEEAEAAAVAAAAAVDAADEELAAVTAPKKEAGRTVEELVELWGAYEQWFQQLTSYDDILRINKRVYPAAVGSFLQERAGDEEKELIRLVERYQVLQWFAGACLPWTQEKKEFYIKTALQLVWDEEFGDEDRETMLFERELMPASMLAVVSNTHYYTHKTRAQTYNIIRYISADTNQLEHMCNGRTKCDMSIMTESKKSDPLGTLSITAATTGQLYGFVTTEKGGWVFKSSRPPASASQKLKLGEKCDNVSNINKHRVKVVELGEILAAAGAGNYSLTEEILDRSKRKIENVKRMCMLLDFTLRYMDNMGVEGKRWFYRPIEARRAGHGGKA